MSKQTAVSHLEKKLNEIICTTRHIRKYELLILDAVIEAKEIERQNIIEAYLDGTAKFDNAAKIVRPLTPEDYYNQTFKRK